MRPLIAFALFFVTSLIVYRHDLSGNPRGDHWSFMSERQFVQTDTDFFINMVSFSRTRHIAKGDAYLFRPAMMAVLALEDILFRANSFIPGILTIAWHGLICTVLLELLATYLPLIYAGSIAAFFSVQYSGMEAILWRHIGPYLLGLLFFGLFVFWISRLLRSERGDRMSLAIAAACCFLATCFYESTGLAIVTGAAIFLLPPGSELPVGRKTLLAVCGVPILIYVGWDLIDAVLHRDAFSAAAATDSATNLLSFLGRTIVAEVGLLGVVAVAFFFPFTLTFFFHPKNERLAWDYSQISPVVRYGLGIVLLVAVIAITIGCVRRYRTEENRDRWIVPFFFVAYFWVATITWAALRMVAREESYMYISTYDYYVTNLLLCVVFALGVRWDLNKKWLYDGKAFAVFVLPCLVLNYFGVQKTLAGGAKLRQLKSDSVSAISQYLREHPSYCFGGSVGEDLAELVNSTLLFRQSCDVHKSTPIYAILGVDGRMWMARVMPGEVAPHNPEAVGLSRSELFLSDKPNFLGRAVQLDALADPPQVHAEIEPGFNGGLVVDMKDERNFIYLFISKGVLQAFRVVDGAFKPLGTTLHSVHSQGGTTISIFPVDGIYYVSEWANILMALPEVKSLGRVGVFESSKGSIKQQPFDVFTVDGRLQYLSLLSPLPEIQISM